MKDGALANAQDYYGKVLGSSEDLRTDACTTTAAPPPHVRRALGRVHPEVSDRYFGCGLIAPEGMQGMRVLDLGCGAGRDVYVLAQLAGESGAVVGIDATAEQLAVARRHGEWHRKKFDYERSNVSFVLGDITKLDCLGLDPASFDIIVSNCAINLVEDKASVFTAAHRLLKPGGEFYFSDVYADRRVPGALRADPVLHGECLAGALYWNDFLGLARAARFRDPRLVADRPLAILDVSVQDAIGAIRFFSATYRLFNIHELEQACEDFGQAVVYRGHLPEAPDCFVLDKHHRFEANKVVPVCGNTWRMLAETRFGRHFDFIGDFAKHFGLFENCGLAMPFDGAHPGAAQTSACC